MVTIITTNKIKIDGKFENAVNEIISSCQEIQSNATDEALVDIATEVIMSLDNLEKYYAN